MQPSTVLGHRVTPRFLGTNDVDGWLIKTYGVAVNGPRPRAALIRAACRSAAGTLPRRPDLVGAYGVGFLIIRDAPDRCLVMIDWWADVDDLYQRIYTAPADRPQDLTELGTGVVGAVADLVITAHEREAWLRHVVDHPFGPDINGYLHDTRR